MNWELRPVAYSEGLFADLLDEADDGRFLHRLREQWLNGEERYVYAGELLLGAFDGHQLIGVGAVSLDPYEPADGLARLRHVYVAKRWRRRGVGRRLVEQLIAHACCHFTTLRLRTSNPAAARLYEELGFISSSCGRETHRLQLQTSSTSRP
jgi:ribosomal protein S18 acetylase RimI-like enzyme